jgi:putative colanic acid biosynthesis glycosyltransferase
VETLVFTVVTVTLNDVLGLEKTWRSLDSQEARDFEWVVVDGGSRDGTDAFLGQISCTYLRWISEEDGGIYDAMNKGLGMSRGEYVVFLNAGDCFAGRQVLQDTRTAIRHSDMRVDIVFGGASLCFPYDREVYRPPRPCQDYIWHGLPAIHQATFFRTELARNVGYDLTYRICGDYYIVAKFYMLGAQDLVLNTTLADFRVGDTSYRNPRRLMIEAYRVQRDVLKLPLGSRVRSGLKRMVSTLGFVVLSQRLPILPSWCRFWPRDRRS